MAKETISEIKEIKKEIKVCDYCRLITEEDINDDEEFSEMLLNPCQKSIDAKMFKGYFNRMIACDTEKEANDLLNEFMWFEAENTADLCPNCTEQLFGEEEPTGIRAGTGYL